MLLYNHTLLLWSRKAYTSSQLAPAPTCATLPSPRGSTLFMLVKSIVTPSSMLAKPALGAWPRPLIAKEQFRLTKEDTASPTCTAVDGWTMQDGWREDS